MKFFRFLLRCQLSQRYFGCVSLYVAAVSQQRIFVFNVKALYRFLLSLKLDLHELVFIPYSEYLSIKNPILIYKEKKQINNIYFTFFKNIKNADIYIFSNVFNWRIFGIIGIFVGWVIMGIFSNK